MAFALVTIPARASAVATCFPLSPFVVTSSKIRRGRCQVRRRSPRGAARQQVLRGISPAVGVVERAPAALAPTFLTSIADIAAYAILNLRTSGSIAPDWVLDPLVERSACPPGGGRWGNLARSWVRPARRSPEAFPRQVRRVRRSRVNRGELATMLCPPVHAFRCSSQHARGGPSGS